MSEDANKKEEYARNLMERAVREYDRIFIDTCSLLDPKVDIFWENLLPFLKKYIFLNK